MEVIIQPDARSAAQLVVKIIANEIRMRPQLVLGLATGKTMEKVYQQLVILHQQEGLDFSRCRTFNLDEYVGLSPDDENSYHYYMDRHFFSKININPRNTHLPNGTASDLDAECRQYEKAIQQAGGIDLQLLGIGQDGHIGFNEPLSALRSKTRCKALTPDTIAQNAPLFKDPELMPRRAITMGVGTILESKRCILLATGAEKSDIIAKAVEGPITSMISASALQLHPQCTVFVDKASASKLQSADYYHWIFNHEPEWEEYR